MKKFLFTFLIILTTCLPVYAENFVFPVPQGKTFNINGYNRAPTHASEKSKYSIDFQMKDTTRPAMKDFGQQCYSIGAPILASKAGKVLDAKYPDSTVLNEGYGVFVRIGYPDGSYTWYGHMLEGTLAVKKGDQVEQGQILGLLGATGTTIGQLCYWENSIGSQVKNEAPHLHFETNKNIGGAIVGVLQEPLVGQEDYTDIVDLQEKWKEYYSTTPMYDPTGHWAKYAGKVPYRLTYNPTRISSLSPLMVEGGKEQVFTIKGNNLFENLKVTLPGCGSFKWLKKESNEQQFSCTFVKPDQIVIKPGFIEFGAEKLHFKIELLPDSTLPSPIITKAESLNPVAGKLTDFVVEGQHLPGDLKLTGFECEETTYKSISPDKQEFSCKLPTSIYEGGQRVNRLYTFNSKLSSAEKSYNYPFSFDANYEVDVHRIDPSIAHAGEKTLFSFVGNNLHLIGAIWVENCQGLREVGRTEGTIRFECSFPTEEEERFMSLITPNVFRQNKYRILLKDKPGGTALLDEKISVFYYKNLHTVSEKEMIEGGGMLEDNTVLDLPDIDDYQAIIDYILESGGKYDDAFLRKTGWQNVGTQAEPVYKLLDCKTELKEQGGIANKMQLNTIGQCAQGLNNVFLESE